MSLLLSGIVQGRWKLKSIREHCTGRQQAEQAMEVCDRDLHQSKIQLKSNKPNVLTMSVSVYNFSSL